MSPIIKNVNLILIFLGGFVASGFFKDGFVFTSIPIIVALSAFLGIVFNRIKHLDDLNLKRKKDVSLSFVDDASEYGAVLVSLIEPPTTMASFFSNLQIAAKKLASSTNKFHAICSDDASSKIEDLNRKLTITLMIAMSEKAVELEHEPNKLELIKCFLSDGTLSELNDIRYEILKLVKNEINDGASTAKFKTAIEKSNAENVKALSKLVGIPVKE